MAIKYPHRHIFNEKRMEGEVRGLGDWIKANIKLLSVITAARKITFYHNTEYNFGTSNKY